jgi:mRNA-degrading endonuclease RelE of RelBE toxin-antitoxin system
VTTIELTNRAVKDVKGLDRATRERIREGLEQLRTNYDNLDVVTLVGSAPWRRLRVGDFRVIFRPMTAEEAKTFEASRGFFIARIVNRRDLHRAVATLPDTTVS